MYIGNRWIFELLKSTAIDFVAFRSSDFGTPATCSIRSDAAVGGHVILAYGTSLSVRSHGPPPSVVMERAAKTTGAGMASMTATVLVCVLCGLVCAPAFSLDRDRSITQFYYTFWNEKDGAPSQITALAQAEDGYLWIGSEQGLFRFDGVRFEESSQ